MSNTKIYPLPKRWGGDPRCGGGEGKTHLFALRQRIEVYGNDPFQFRGWASLLKKSCLEPCLKPHPSTKLHHERATASVSLFFKKKTPQSLTKHHFLGFLVKFIPFLHMVTLFFRLHVQSPSTQPQLQQSIPHRTVGTNGPTDPRIDNSTHPHIWLCVRKKNVVEHHGSQ